MVFAYGKFTTRPTKGMLVWPLSDSGRGKSYRPDSESGVTVYKKDGMLDAEARLKK